MSNKFPSFVLKSKRSNQAQSGGVAKSSSNSTTSARSHNSFMISTTNSSKNRTNKPPFTSPALQITPNKTLLKASQPPTLRKQSCTLPSSKLSPFLLTSTSDDLSKALVLKKKNFSRTSTPSLERKKSSKTARRGASKVVAAATTAKADVAGNKDVRHLVLVEMADENRKLKMHQEGPVEIQEGTFDFYSILARPKIWDVEEDLEETRGVSDSLSTNEIALKMIPPSTRTKYMVHTERFSSDSYTLIKREESEIWGSMRASTAEESSTPPSLTSIGESEMKACAPVDLKKESEEEMKTRDENNNVFETLKNNFYRSQASILEASGPTNTTTNIPTTNTTALNASTSEKIEENESKEIEPEVDYDKGNRQANFSTSKELDQVNESEGKINVQLCHNNHNSPTPPEIPLCGINPDSSLNPLEIEKQLEEALGVNSANACSVESQQEHQLKNHFGLQTKLEKGEVVEIVNPRSEENPPTLTMSSRNIKDPSSSQLVLNECKNEHTGLDVKGTSHSCDYENNSLKRISPTFSFTSAVAVDEEHFFADTVENSKEFDSQQTQTTSVSSQDAETATESNIAEDKREKLKSLVNAGVDIAPLEPPKKSVRMCGIMKTCRTESILIEGTVPIFSTSLPSSKIGDANLHRRDTSEKIKYPKTFSQVWADYGFPSVISISGMIGNIGTLTWASPNREVEKFKGRVAENNRANNDTFCTDVDGTGEGSRLIETACDIVNAGLKYASDFIGAEADLEPREDWVRYNGYNICPLLVVFCFTTLIQKVVKIKYIVVVKNKDV